MDSALRRSLPRLARLAGALAVVAAITFFYARLVSVNATTVALTFLLGILAIATGWGLVEAIEASFAAVFCFNYFFLPPVGALTIADPQNWVALVAFLVTAVVASQLSARARREALEATRRQHEMERLYALSRNLMLGGQENVAGRISYQVAQAFDLPGVAFYDRAAGLVCRAGPAEVPMSDDRLRDVAVQDTVFQDADVWALPVKLGGAPLGALAVTGGEMSDTALHAIANLAAIEFERARAEETAARAEAARQNEQLKATLLDAVAHDFKTPLTAIKAAVSGLLAGAAADPQHELLTVVDEETDRLSSMITDAIQMARVEAGNLRLEKSLRAPAQIVSATLRRFRKEFESRTLEVDAGERLPHVEVDAGLATLALAQLLDNALRYSRPGSPIAVRVSAKEGSVVITVADRGPGVPEEERARVLEKYFRGRGAAGSAGTGMGLPIAREIVEAHGGRLWFEPRQGGGAEFSIALPAAAERGQP